MLCHNFRAYGKCSKLTNNRGFCTLMIWTPRDYQEPVFTRIAAGVLRQFLAWHRRAGKDVTALQVARREMDRVPGTYWHLFPIQAQARRAIWLGMDNDGNRYLDQAFPLEWRKRTIDHMTTIESHKGSIWQMAGSDKFHELVGANVRGVIFSEWSRANALAWEYIRPMLVENGGWAMFITTFYGRNHAWKMAQANMANPRWYVDIRDITQTHRHDGSPVVTLEDVQKEREDGMPEPLIQQEFYCNPSAAAEHAYFGEFMPQALAA